MTFGPVQWTLLSAISLLLAWRYILPFQSLTGFVWRKALDFLGIKRTTSFAELPELFDRVTDTQAIWSQVGGEALITGMYLIGDGVQFNYTANPDSHLSVERVEIHRPNKHTLKLLFKYQGLYFCQKKGGRIFHAGLLELTERDLAEIKIFIKNLRGRFAQFKSGEPPD